MKKLGMLVLVMVVGLVANVLAVEIPIANGSFETAPYDTYGVVPSWKFDAASGTMGQIVLAKDDCPDGSGHALRWSNNDSSWAETYQNVKLNGSSYYTQAGKTYTVSLDFNNGTGFSNPTIGWNTFYLGLYVFGVSQAELLIYNTDSMWTADNQWKTLTTSFVCTEDFAGSRVMIDLTVGCPIVGTSTNPWIDNVRMSEVPEPCTLAMLVGGVVFAVRRKMTA